MGETDKKLKRKKVVKAKRRHTTVSCLYKGANSQYHCFQEYRAFMCGKLMPQKEAVNSVRKK